MTDISVVIPAYNRASLISPALDSASNQSLRPNEIIVVDDGSTDETLLTVSSWITKNPEIPVRVIRQTNQGANAARNNGIKEARGECIAFLDSDDYWLPEKLAKQLELFGQNPNLGGVYCGTRTLDLVTGEKGPLIPRSYPSGNLVMQMLIGDVTAPTSCWLVRKKCFEEVGAFDKMLPARQDWDMWIRLSEKYEIGAVPEVLVEMGEHSGERVRTNEDREIKAHRIIFDKYRDLRAAQPFWVSLAARSTMYRRRGRMYFHKKGQYARAVGLQILAIAVWPFAFDSYAALMGMALSGGFRQKLHVFWNRLFGRTRFAIKSH